jgi:hypothetical protein
VPLSALDSVTPAIEHTKQQAFKPFSIVQWTKLAFVGLLAGELSSSGCNLRSAVPHGTRSGGGLPGIDPAILGALVAVLIVCGIVLGLLLMYVSSVFRFILFDSVLRKRCEIAPSWHERQAPGFRLFLWTLGFTILWGLSFVVFLGIPALMVFAAGWFNRPKEHLAPLVLLGVLGLFVGLLLACIGALVHVLTKDFVVPQMAIEGIGPIEAWRRLLAMMDAEKGGYIGYVGLKILLAIAAGIIFGIIGAIVAVVFIIPVGGIAAAVVLGGKAAGLTWNLYTITAGVLAALGLVFLLLYVLSLVSVPAIVFFPAYSIYFFASRYPSLSAVLYPANAPPLPPPVAPAWTPPPEPIG